MAAEHATTPGRFVRSAILAASAAVLALASPAPGQVLRAAAPEEDGVDVEEKLGEQVPPDVRLTDAEGRAVTTARYLDGTMPAALVFVYYECPLICDLVLQRLGDAFNNLEYTIGEDFRVVVVSFDYRETREHAARAKALHITGYNRPVTSAVRDGWAFHVGEASEVRRLARSVGYSYKLLDSGEYSHPVAMTILSPEGKITRYLYGFDYPPRELRMSILDASQGTISRSFGDMLSGFCYIYDPDRGSYTLQAMRVMQLAGGATVLMLAVLIGGLFIFERVRRRAAGYGGRKRRDGNGRVPAAPITVKTS